MAAEAFRKVGITLRAGGRPKSQLYADLLPLLNSGRADLLDEPRLIAQLVGLERRTARGGRDSIDHAPGVHDDVANAVAGALVMVGSGQRAAGCAALSRPRTERPLEYGPARPAPAAGFTNRGRG